MGCLPLKASNFSYVGEFLMDVQWSAMLQPQTLDLGHPVNLDIELRIPIKNVSGSPRLQPGTT